MFIFIMQTRLASRNRLLRIITASQVDCLSCIWMLENFLWMIWTILSISFGVIGLVRLCSSINSLRGSWTRYTPAKEIKTRLFLFQSLWNESLFFFWIHEGKKGRRVLMLVPSIESWKIADVSRQERDREGENGEKVWKKQGGKIRRKGRERTTIKKERNETKDAYV